MPSDPAMIEELFYLVGLLEAHKSKILLEDRYGSKYEIAVSRVTGSNTNDPAVILKII